ncbi:unnamed protein product, partial [Dovyalis caffra]
QMHAYRVWIAPNNGQSTSFNYLLIDDEEDGIYKLKNFNRYENKFYNAIVSSKSVGQRKSNGRKEPSQVHASIPLKGWSKQMVKKSDREHLESKLYLAKTLIRTTIDRQTPGTNGFSHPLTITEPRKYPTTTTIRLDAKHKLDFSLKLSQHDTSRFSLENIGDPNSIEFVHEKKFGEMGECSTMWGGLLAGAIDDGM